MTPGSPTRGVAPDRPGAIRSMVELLACLFHLESGRVPDRPPGEDPREMFPIFGPAAQVAQR